MCDRHAETAVVAIVQLADDGSLTVCVISARMCCFGCLDPYTKSAGTAMSSFNQRFERRVAVRMAVTRCTEASRSGRWIIG